MKELYSNCKMIKGTPKSQQDKSRHPIGQPGKRFGQTHHKTKRIFKRSEIHENLLSHKKHKETFS
jgi:hypothetical protein